MIINSHGQSFFCFLLTDDIIIQKSSDLLGLHQIDAALVLILLIIFIQFFIHDLCADLNTLVADIDAFRTGDEFSHLIL